MAIDKALYEAPVGLEEAAMAEPEVEIEIVDPESVTIGMDGVEIEITPGQETSEDFNANLVEFLDAGEMESIVSQVAGDVRNDLNSRSDWEKMLKEGIQLLGLKYEERSEPWSGACGVFHPMITEAVVRFQADTIMETFPAPGPVKTKIVGKITREKEEAAARVAEDLNWQLTENMSEFRPEHEKMLWGLPASGAAFKKVYKDPMLDRQTSVYVAAEDIILPYGASDLQTSPRITHRMRKTKNEVAMLQADGFWVDSDLGEPSRMVDDIRKTKDTEAGVSAINDDRYLIDEVCVDLDLPGYEDVDKDGNPTGVALPYILTYVVGSNIPLSLRRNWRENDNKRRKRLHYVQYTYVPGFGPYGFGLFHLIGGYAKAGTSILRQLVDAGTLSNLPGGLKSRGLRIKGDDTPIAPGEFRDVDVGSGAIRDNILPLPYKEPSQVLAGLLDKIIDEGRRLAASSDLKIADMSAQTPVGTTLALLERTLKPLTAVQARVHYSFKHELQLIAEIVREDSPANEEYSYDVDAPQGRKAKYEDYRHVEIIPVSDPNAATLTQRIVQYQAVVQLSQSAPQIYNLPELHKQMLNVLGIKNVDKLVPTEDDLKPVDPVTENMNILNGKPVKAFAYQDHEAHIAVHMMMKQDPMIQQIVGQNPRVNALIGAMEAHIAEHVGFAYKNKISEALGVPIPQADKDEGMPEEVEFQLSKLLAQAAPQVLAQSKAMVAQQQAQQNMQDPLLQLQKQELDLKAQKQQQDATFKEKKLAVDAAAKADELRLREQEIVGKQQTDTLRVITDAASKADQSKRTTRQ
jgi:hypothetical protein